MTSKRMPLTADTVQYITAKGTLLLAEGDVITDLPANRRRASLQPRDDSSVLVDDSDVKTDLPAKR